MSTTADQGKQDEATALRCSLCTTDVVFVSREQARSHQLEYHSAAFVVRVKNKSGTEQAITVRQVDGTYRCPLCSDSFQTKTSCRRHLQDSCSGRNETEQVLLPVVLPDVPNIPSSLLEVAETAPPLQDHDRAILSACQKASESDDEKLKILFLIEALKLRPFALRDELGLERHALAHQTVVDKLVLGQVAVVATDLPRKRRFVEDESRFASGLENLLAASPYASTLLSRTFVELDGPLCELLNEDWCLQPQLQYACAQALAGSIFLNTKNGQAVINNTVEAYGRKKSVDTHRERFSTKKGVATMTSLPPPTKTRYKDVWPLTILDSDGEGLFLGTHSFNALVTSSLRLDSREPASVGGSTSSFQLRDKQDSAATRIFLDKESVECALDIARNKNASYISASNKLDQLRQLRSNFHDGSTYRLCRATGFLTKRHTCNPYTVFTLLDFDQSQLSEGQTASTIFHEIAKDVLSQGSRAVLRLETVTKLRTQCSERGNIGKLFDKIIGCFPSGQQTIPVIGNTILNTELKALAEILSSYISTANKSVASFVQDCFPL
ncbi:MAG: hypothetical protein JOS17DRAFT_16065 [Linnemannia elongata]|nr:MAG: hypothetical protein JOS17DRAFT_16065 [Linnemannia elongata]